jgi:hypothetical protein
MMFYSLSLIDRSLRLLVRYVRYKTKNKKGDLHENIRTVPHRLGCSIGLFFHLYLSEMRNDFCDGAA